MSTLFYKCNYNYQSKFAYINNEHITIIEYINQYKNQQIKCNKGHELILCNNKNKTVYFKHKNIGDIDNTISISKWRAEWQSNFPYTDISFSKINVNQIKNRSADVLLKDYNIVLEFQDSKINQEEVQNRINDYKLHNINITWIIDGKDTIKQIEYNNRLYLEFISDEWKYNSFLSCLYIFIDLNDMIYKISPSEVKSNMIDVEKPINKLDFIILLNTNDIQLITPINMPYQCTLYIKQQGAGNGKTYGLIQMINSNDFEYYTNFIIVTKQHSAKFVIYNEFKSQIELGKLCNLQIIANYEASNKYIIKYINIKTNNNCQIIIGTIDSLCYVLGSKNNNYINSFEGLVYSIIDDFIDTKSNNIIKYGSLSIELNKRTCLICDETQDLSEYYGQAIIKIMKSKYINSYIVGDKLQSLNYKNNAFTYLIENEFKSIQKIQYESINICRRFSNYILRDFVNHIIYFDKYSLPNITIENVDTIDNNSLTIFIGTPIFDSFNNTTTTTTTADNDIVLNEEVRKIMSYYINEVNLHNYQPNDFLIITPFTKNNPLVNAIELAIDTFWLNKFNNNEYIRYAIFHKSEEGSSIDLSESENATRIVSIHTSKGDGRNIVFVIGLDESSLLKFSNEKNTLIFESLIHVAITRMKKRLYLRIIENGDEIYKRILSYKLKYNLDFDIKPKLLITKKLNWRNVTDYITTLSNITEFNNTIIPEHYLTYESNIDKNITIDMGHHKIRYASMIIYLFINILNSIQDKNQIKAIFYKVKDAKIETVYNWSTYNKYLINNNETQTYKCSQDIVKPAIIPLLKLSTYGRDYNMYYNIIKDNIINIQNKIEKILNNKIKKLCPLESIILYFIIQICHQGIYTEFTINELYNLINIYSKSFSKKCFGHKKCLCKSLFNKYNTDITNTVITKLNTYLLTHYEQIQNISIIYEQFLNNHLNINWLINHRIPFNGNNNDYKINYKFQLIGYDNNTVYIVYVKPQLTNLNYFKTMIESIYDTFLLYTINKSSNIIVSNNEYNKSFEDNIKFGNKQIITIIFSLNNQSYNTFKWIHKDENLIEKHNCFIIDKIKDALLNKYINESKHIYYFYNYYKNKFCNDNLTANEIINSIKDIIENNDKKSSYPDFIYALIYKIKNEIDEMPKTKKINILNMYDNEEYFTNALNIKIKNSIYEFLNIDD